ncbi:MAG TPA: mechanosensitive ion channel family protein [Flavipsychrobacter sp.]|nr:mechanosensitive ion channel family protein [Flavipsychrobacter sp.]
MLLLQIVDSLAAQGKEQIVVATTWAEKLKNLAIDYAPKIAGAILVYFIGSWLISKFTAVVRKMMMRRHLDPSLQSFLSSMLKVTLLLLLFLTAISMLGVNITSFAAILAGAGLAIGAALNGSLGNLAGGVMLMIYKPFKVGDLIEAQGMVGVVTEIGIFNTTLLSPENKTVIIPNGALSTGVMTNYHTHGNLRVDLKMAVDPTMDLDKARQVAIAAMKTHPKVLQEPAPEVNVSEVANGMVTLAIRPYTTANDYWDVYFGVQELVKKAFDKEDIKGPIPHHVVISKPA